MATEAVPGQNRLHVLIEIKVLLRGDDLRPVASASRQARNQACKQRNR
jgi:hypothetical protein